MNQLSKVKIPMFPLSLLPLPGEMVPLHIFEPRYKQLLHDAESRDISFGIYPNIDTNAQQIGALVKLESVIKRYEEGNLDIIVKCIDLFEVTRLLPTFKDKMYPGGEVVHLNVDAAGRPTMRLQEEFMEYLALVKISKQPKERTIFEIAAELLSDVEGRLRFVQATSERKEEFLFSRLHFQNQLLHEAVKAKDTFHLN